MKNIHNISVVALMLFASCEKDNPLDYSTSIHPSVKLLHISHTRDAIATSLSPGVDQIDYSKYELVMLGGDLLFNTSINSTELGIKSYICGLEKKLGINLC